MADTDRDAPEPLNRRAIVASLLREPTAHDFFASLRSLQALPGVKAFGTSLRPKEEVVRFAQEPTLAFAGAAISGAQWDEERERLDLLLQFTGLLGPNGPMPVHLTEYVLDRRRHHDDPTIGAFLNLFQHRIYSLFFRAWALSQPAVDRDRPDARRHAFYLRSLIGLGTAGTENRDTVPDDAKIFHAGWIGGTSRSPDGLAAILSDYLQVPVKVQSFQGAWLELPADSRCVLGRSPTTGVLGSTCFAGERVWLSHLKFRVRLGPLHLGEYERLLPGGAAFSRIRDWIRNYVGDEFCWEAQFMIRRDEVPPCALGGKVRLGWNTWIGAPASDRDLDDMIVQSG